MVKYKQKDSLSSVFHALASPTRRQILTKIDKDSPIAVLDIAKHHKISLPAVSKHLRLLEKTKLIKRTKKGREYYFTTEKDNAKKALDWINDYSKHWQNQLNNLDKYLNNN